MALIGLLKLSALALLLGLGGLAEAAAKVYCCIDADGKQVCADILPPTCYGRAYRELGSSGGAARTVEAPLTADQRTQRAADEAQRKAQEVVLKEKQRADQALLNTYGSPKDIEAMRARALDDVEKAIRSAEARIAEIRIKRKGFENEAEFYKKKQLPPDVQKGLRDADLEIKAQEQLIEAKKHESAVIGAKYDEDSRRYLDLQRRTTAPR
jgi:hypothetical protein